MEALTGIDLPTSGDLGSIELSSRLCEEHGAIFMTASVVCTSQGNRAETTAIAFVTAKDKPAAIRYGDPPSRTQSSSSSRSSPWCSCRLPLAGRSMA